MAKKPAKPNTEAAEGVVSEPQEQDAEVETLRRELMELKADLAAERGARVSAEAGKSQAERRVLSEAERRVAAEEAACDSSISTMQSEADTIEARIAELAEEPGNGKAIAELNRRMARLESSILAEQGRKQYLTSLRQQAKSEAERVQSQPTEVLADGRPLSQFAPDVQDWFRKHPEVFTNRRYLREAVRAAEDAVDEGHAERSPGYFQYVSEVMSQKFPAPQQRAAAPSQDYQPSIPNADSPYSTTTEQGEVDYRAQNPQPPAAGRGSMSVPPTRNVPTGGQQRTGRAPNLTPDQRAAADDLYPELNPADRYVKYATNQQYMEARRSGRPFAMN